MKDRILNKARNELAEFKKETLAMSPEEIYDNWEIISFKEMFAEALEDFLLPFLPDVILTKLDNMEDMLQTIYLMYIAEDVPYALSNDDFFDWLLMTYEEDIRDADDTYEDAEDFLENWEETEKAFIKEKNVSKSLEESIPFYSEPLGND